MRTLSAADTLRMSVPAATFFNVERLRRYDGPEFFLAGGFLLGLLIFLVWLSMRPEHDKPDLRARGNGVVSADAMAQPGHSVLGEITGDAPAGGNAQPREGNYFFSEGDADADAQAEAEAAADGALAPGPDFEQDGGPDPDAMAVGEDVGSSVYPEAGALTDSLLDAPPPAVDAPAGPAPPTAVTGAALRPWFIEVEVAPGQVQMLQLNAESPEHALAILRDFRGNPRVLRGPSAEPLP